MATLASIVLKYKNHLQSVGEKSVADLGSRIKEGTPKDTGDARKSWRESGHFKIGQPYLYVSKGVDYIRDLEYGRSDQAPHGMVRINVAKWPEIVKKHAKSA